MDTRILLVLFLILQTVEEALTACALTSKGQCYPGSCSGGNCKCPRNWSPSSDQCGLKYSPPEIETCRIAVEAADRTLAQSILGPQWGRPTTHCQNEAPAHINFQPKKLKGTVEVIHQLAGFKAPHSKDYPSWLKNFKFGVTDVSVKFTKKYYDSNSLVKWGGVASKLQYWEANHSCRRMQIDAKAPATGYIREFHFYAFRAGNAIMDVWRPVNGNGRTGGYKLVGSFNVRSYRFGVHKYVLPPGDRFEVQKGDIFGHHYRGEPQSIFRYEGSSGTNSDVTDAQRNDKTNTKVYCQKDSFDDCSVVKTPTTRLECVGDVGTKDKCLKLQHCCWDSSIKPNCYMSYKNPSFNYDIYGMMSKTPIYVSYFVPSYYFVIEVPKSTAIATSSYSSSCSKVPSATAPVYSQLIKCEKEENYPSGKDPLKDGEQLCFDYTATAGVIWGSSKSGSDENGVRVKPVCARVDLTPPSHGTGCGSLMGYDSRALNTEVGHYRQAVKNVPIMCDGEISHWTFTSTKKGREGWFDVWRPVGDGKYKFLGSNHIVTYSDGFEVHEVPYAYRIQVRKGDILGTHVRGQTVQPFYMEGETGTATPGVVRTDFDEYAETAADDKQHGSWKVGDEEKLNFRIKRLPGWRAHVSPPSAFGNTFKDGNAGLDGATTHTVAFPYYPSTKNGYLDSFVYFATRQKTIYFEILRHVKDREHFVVHSETIDIKKTNEWVTHKVKDIVEIKKGYIMALKWKKGSAIPYTNTNGICPDHKHFWLTWHTSSEKGKVFPHLVKWTPCRRYLAAFVVKPYSSMFGYSEPLGSSIDGDGYRKLMENSFATHEGYIDELHYNPSKIHPVHLQGNKDEYTCIFTRLVTPTGEKTWHHVKIRSAILVKPNDILGIHWEGKYVLSKTFKSPCERGYMRYDRYKAVATIGKTETFSTRVAQCRWYSYYITQRSTRDVFDDGSMLPPFTTLDGCFAGLHKLDRMNTPAGNWRHIYPEQKFKCSGRLTEWHIFAWQDGTIYLDIWRPNAAGDKITLIHKHECWAPSEGYHVCKVPDADSVDVKEGDYIGLHYSKKRSNGILYFDNEKNEKTGRTLTYFNKESDLPNWKLMSGPAYDEDSSKWKDLKLELKSYKIIEAFRAYIGTETFICQSGKVALTARNWLDPYPTENKGEPSTFTEFQYEVFQMTVAGPMVKQTATIDPKGSFHEAVNIELPKKQHLYSIVVTAKDLAGNAREARRHVMYDPDSTFKTDPNMFFGALSGLKATKYQWQDNLGAVNVTWDGHIYNALYAANNYLLPSSTNDVFHGQYEHLVGEMNVGGTRNKHGIVRFQKILREDDFIGSYVPQETDWTDISIDQFDSSRMIVKEKPVDGDGWTIWLRGFDIKGAWYNTSTQVFVDSSPPELTKVGISNNFVNGLFVHKLDDLSKMPIAFDAFDPHSNIRSMVWAMGTTPYGSELGDNAIGVNKLNPGQSCADAGFTAEECSCPRQGLCQQIRYTVDFNHLIAQNKHYGTHHRVYYFHLNVTNAALLQDGAHVEILVDISPPVAGAVNDGELDMPEVDYLNSDKWAAYWRGFYDHESGIRQYRVAIATACIDGDRLINMTDKSNDAKYYTVDGDKNYISGMSYDKSPYYVTVVAFNGAQEPSEPVCSDGVTVDTTPPVIKDVVIHGISGPAGIGCYENKPYVVWSNQTKQELAPTPLCKRKCNSLEALVRIQSVPYLLPWEQSDSICGNFKGYELGGVMSLTKDAIHVDWDYEEPDGEVHEFLFGVSSVESNTINPDLFPFESTHTKKTYRKRNAAFGHGSRFFIVLKAVNKALQEKVEVFGPIVVDETPPHQDGKVNLTVTSDLVKVTWKSTTFQDPETGIGKYELAIGTALDPQIALPFHQKDQGSCEVVGAINKLSTLSGNWMQIFRNFFIPCNGHIREWRLFAGVTGVINFGVWRKVPNEEKMMLVGKNKITVTSLNMSSHSIDPEDQIYAQKDDVVGVHFDSGSAPGVYYYDISTKPLSEQYGVTKDHPYLSCIIGEQKYDAGLIPGTTKVNIPGSCSQKRVPSFAAILTKDMEAKSEDPKDLCARKFTTLRPTGHCNGGACSYKKFFRGSARDCAKEACEIGSNQLNYYENSKGCYIKTCGSGESGHTGYSCTVSLLRKEEDVASVGAPMEKLDNPQGDSRAGLLVDWPFTASGRLKYWDLYAVKVKTLYLGVWRLERKQCWRLLGVNKVEPTKVGYQRFYIPEDEQIMVHAGDVFGYYHDPVADRTEGGVVRWEGNSKKRVASWAYTRLIQQYKYSDTIKVNQQWCAGWIPGAKILVSIQAYVESPAICTAGSLPIKMNGGTEGSYIKIYTHHKFQCRGKVTSIRYNAARTGDFIVGIWRPLGGKPPQFELIAKTTFVASKTGYNLYELKSSEILPVEQGDVFGVHYPKARSYGVLYLERKSRTQTYQVDSSEIGYIHNRKIYDPSMKVGYIARGYIYTADQFSTSLQLLVTREKDASAAFEVCNPPPPIGHSCYSYPTAKIKEFDAEAYLDYRVALRAVNSAGLSISTFSDYFSVTSSFGPSRGLVFDVKTEAAMDFDPADSDYLVGKKVCAHWKGFNHPTDIVEYQVGLGVAPGKTSIADYVFVNETRHHCFEVELQHLQQYYFTVVAMSVGGSVRVTSDGFTWVNETYEFEKSFVNDGAGCEGSQRLWRGAYSRAFTRKGYRTYFYPPSKEYYSVGRLYSLLFDIERGTTASNEEQKIELYSYINSEKTTIGWLDVTHQEPARQLRWFSFIATTTRQSIYMTSHTSARIILRYISLHACTSELEYSTSRRTYMAWWHFDWETELAPHITHYEVRVREFEPREVTDCHYRPNCPQDTGNVTTTAATCPMEKYDCNTTLQMLDRGVIGGPVETAASKILIDSLNMKTGFKYTGEITPCFQHVCMPPKSTNGMFIMDTKPVAGSSNIYHTYYKLDDNKKTGVLYAAITFQPFEMNYGIFNDRVKVYRYTISTSKSTVNTMTQWRSYPYYDRRTNQLRASVYQNTPLLWRRDIWFVIEGYGANGLLTTTFTPIEVQYPRVSFFGTGLLLYDLEPTKDMEEEVSELLGSLDLGRHVEKIQNYDIQYTTITDKASGALTGSRHVSFHWYITKTHNMEYSLCTDASPDCLYTKESEKAYVLMDNLELEHGNKYYLCVYADEAKINFTYPLEVTETIPPVQKCSNGFVVDTRPPTAGFVRVGLSESGQQRETNEMFVHWGGFSDVESSVAAGELTHTTGIANYRISIGSVYGKDDVMQERSVGISEHAILSGLNLHSGHLYFVTLKAYDHVGLHTSIVADPVMVDATAPVAGTVHVGSFHSHRAAIGCREFEVHWNGFHDPESAYLRYEVAIGTHSKTQDIMAFKAVTQLSFIVLRNLNTATGHSFYAQVKAINTVGTQTIVSSKPFVCDDTGPQGGVVRDVTEGTMGDVDYQLSLKSLTASWNGFMDVETKIQYYSICWGTEDEACDVWPKEIVQANTEVTRHIKLMPGAKYYATVSACNPMHECHVVSSDGVVPDNSAPYPGDVYIGFDTNYSPFSPNPKYIAAHWIDFEDPESGIHHYEWCIGTSADACDVTPMENVYTSLSASAANLSLTTGSKYYVTVNAFNNVGLSVNQTSLPVTMDTTPPAFQAVPKVANSGIGLRAGTQIERAMLKLEWDVSDAESRIVRQAVTVMTHQAGRVPVKDNELGTQMTVSYPLKEEEELYDGDEYIIKVAACNAAGLCSLGVSEPIKVDSSPPTFGYLVEPMFWSMSGSDLTLYLQWTGFDDAHTKIDKYYIQVGTEYSKQDISQATVEVPHNPNITTQQHNMTVTFTLNPATHEKIYVNIWCDNEVGLNSHVGFLSLEVLSATPSSTDGELKIVKHSCDIDTCQEDCTCAVIGKRCTHLHHADACSNKSSTDVTVHDGWGFTDEDFTSNSNCLRAHWEDSSSSVVRYEWSVGRKGFQPGAGLFDLIEDVFWFNVGMQTSAIFCLPRGRTYEDKTSYTFYVKAWFSATEYAMFNSDGIEVDKTPPTVRRGGDVKDLLAADATEDSEFTLSGNEYHVTWKNVFLETGSNFSKYHLSVGMYDGADDLVETTDKGLDLSHSANGVTLIPGIKYTATVLAVNNVDLTSVQFSDGITFDSNDPIAGVVFLGHQHTHYHWQSSTSTLQAKWIGFEDRETYIKYYQWAIGDSPAATNVMPFTTVDIKNDVIGTGLTLVGDGSKTYYVTVKAFDNAGRSISGTSEGVQVDNTAPEAVVCTNYNTEMIQNGDFSTLTANDSLTHWNVTGKAEATEGGLILRGEIKQTISLDRGLYQLSLLTSSPCDQPHTRVKAGLADVFVTMEENIDGSKCSFGFDIVIDENDDYVTLLHAPSEVTVYSFSIKKCDASSKPALDEAAIEITQFGPLDFKVQWTVHDPQSSVRKYEFAMGSTPGGVQLLPYSNLGRQNFVYATGLNTAPRLQLYATIRACNHAGLCHVITSAPFLVDWTEPEVPIPDVTLTPVPDEDGNFTVTVTAANATDDETDMIGCAWAAGLKRGATNLLDYRDVTASSSGVATGLRFGHEVHVSYRCRNRGNIVGFSYAAPVPLGGAFKPNISSAIIKAVTLSQTAYPATNNYQSNTNSLHVYYSGFVDFGGIKRYFVNVTDASNTIVPTTDVGSQQDVLFDKLSLEDGKDYTINVVAENVVGKTSDALSKTVSVSTSKPTAAGGSESATWQNGSFVQVAWDGVFSHATPNMPLYYELSVGTQEGSGNLLTSVSTKRTSWTFNHVLLKAGDIHVTLKGISASGLYEVHKATVTVPAKPP